MRRVIICRSPSGCLCFRTCPCLPINYIGLYLCKPFGLYGVPYYLYSYCLWHRRTNITMATQYQIARRAYTYTTYGIAVQLTNEIYQIARRAYTYTTYGIAVQLTNEIYQIARRAYTYTTYGIAVR